MELDTRAAGREIARQAMAGEDGDPFGGLNPLDAKFFRNARTALLIPTLDPLDTIRTLQFLHEHIPGLIERIRAVRDKRSGALLAGETLRRWNWQFAKKAGFRK